ncbi:hypothetical protein F4780DRAFT_229377 [Xylariomycetidae sp. FL0641]|nr:hypothetical protein F4780DRAFT_229377 [Xylariomycetidae sp. FL0641]
MVPSRPPCLVCQTAEGKYKCPRCLELTCSFPCAKEHRDNHPSLEPAPVQSPASVSSVTVVNSPASTAAQQAGGQVESVGTLGIVDMPEYKLLKQKYPELEAQLWSIAAATDPPTKQAAIVSKPQKFWDKDVGLQNGLKTLQRAKASPSSAGEAMKEFCELVALHKVRIQQQGADADARKQAAKEDAQAISRLLREEPSS